MVADPGGMGIKCNSLIDMGSLRSCPLPIIPLCLSSQRSKKKKKDAWSQVKTWGFTAAAIPESSQSSIVYTVPTNSFQIWVSHLDIENFNLMPAQLVDNNLFVIRGGYSVQRFLNLGWFSISFVS